MSNPADICRECELSQKVQQLEDAGNHMARLIKDVLCLHTYPWEAQEAVNEWEKAKGGEK